MRKGVVVWFLLAGILCLSPCLAAPSVTFTYPTPDNSSALAQDWFFVNITTDVSAGTCNLTWPNQTTVALSSFNASQWYLNNTGLVKDWYYYTVNCSDLLDGSVGSETRNVSIYLKAITNCTVLNQTGMEYLLAASFSVNASVCFNITSQNVTFDCQSYTATGAAGRNNTAIYSNSSYTRIENCRLSNWKETVEIYEYYNFVENIFLEGMNPEAHGITLHSSHYNHILNVTGIEIYGGGVVSLYSSNYNSIDLVNGSGGFMAIDLTGSGNNITNVHGLNNSYGIFIYDSLNNTLANSVFADNNLNDVEMYARSADYCNNTLQNITGSNGLPILYYNTTVTIGNLTASELILCGAHNSILNNITLNSSGMNSGLVLVSTNSSNISQIYSHNTYAGIQMHGGSHNIFTNIRAYNTSRAVEFSNYGHGSEWNNTVTNSSFQSFYGLYYDWAYGQAIAGNLIYNNIFNSSVDYSNTNRSYVNYLNTSRQAGVPIFGSGTEIGGNYWTNEYGTGFSDTCNDLDRDNFCDSPYELDTGYGNNTDYLPLASGIRYITNCTLLNQSGKLYRLTQDISNANVSTCMNITAVNITLDCQGHLVDGVYSNNSKGIAIIQEASATTSSVIVNCMLNAWGHGVYWSRSDGNLLANSSMNGSLLDGLELELSDYSRIDGVNSSQNERNGIYIYNSDGNNFTNIILSNNTHANGMLLTSSDLNRIYRVTMTGNGGGAYVSGGTSNNLTGVNSTGNDGPGLHLYRSTGNTLANSTFEDNYQADVMVSAFNDEECSHRFQSVIVSRNQSIQYFNYSVSLQNNSYSGLILCGAHNSNLSNITLIGSAAVKNTGLLLVATNGSIITRINSSNNFAGIWIENSNNNQLSNLTLENNVRGIQIQDLGSIGNCTNNTVYDSRFVNNSNGITFSLAQHTYANTFYNNLFNNTYNVYFQNEISANYWNTSRQTGTRIYSSGTEIGGNYWTNSTGNGYSDTCTDANTDGFCDAPLLLNASSNNTDYLPLSRFYQAPSSPVPASGSGGGGGSGGSAPAGQLIYVFDGLEAGQDYSGTIIAQNFPLIAMHMVPDKNIPAARFTLTAVNTTKIIPIDSAYQYFEVSSTVMPVLRSLDFEFAVNKSWLAARSASADDVRLAHYGGGWALLETKRTNQTATRYFYTARVPSLSLFAITLKIPEPATVQTAAPAQPPQQDAVIAAPEAPRDEAPARATNQQRSSNFLPLIIAGAAIALILLGSFALTRPKKAQLKDYLRACDKCLLNGDYLQAVDAYTNAIDEYQRTQNTMPSAHKEKSAADLRRIYSTLQARRSNWRQDLKDDFRNI